MEFKLNTKFKPTGDQPHAIKQLVKNLTSGIRDQVLLGVTGSGKSITPETPVVVKLNGKTTCNPIGRFVDELFQKYPDKIRVIEDSEIIFTDSIKKEKYIETISLNPKNKQTEWKAVTQLVRHTSPKNLYEVKTTCGREITVTGDHNFWVLRKGKLTLMPTKEVEKTDFIPLPTDITTSEKDLSHIDTLEVLNKNMLFANANLFVSRVLMQRKLSEVIQAMGKYYAFPRHKVYQIMHGAYCGMPISTIDQISREFKIDTCLEDFNKIVVGSQIHNYSLPGKVPLTEEWLKLMGYYIAEGHGEPKSRFFTISAAEKYIQKDLRNTLKKLSLNYHRGKYRKCDFNITSKIHTEFLVSLLGSNSRSKKLPSFWPDLSQKQLAVLLQTYFNGDGGAFPKSGEVVAPTASKQLASDISYALLRFGIWARINKRWSHATNSLYHKGSYYYYITISGKENLEKFKKCIGFSLPRKQKNLITLYNTTKGSNVDIIPDVGPQIKKLRTSLKISQRVFSEMAGVVQGTLNSVELGINNPRKQTFEKIINCLVKVSGKSNEVNELKSLLNCHWLKIAEIKEVASQCPYVYDFAVKGNETFLAGFGGLFAHNTFTMANVINEVKKPTLIVACNKTLAAQLYQEFKEFFPNNGVHYFVSYYDYYQPEAYIPQTDTYIEKDAKINEEIDRLRHAAAQDVLSRKDAIVVASVSCIYNIGSPENYQSVSLEIKANQKITRKEFISHLIAMQYKRNDIDFKPATFRVRGEMVEIYLVTGEKIVRVEFSGDKIHNIFESPSGPNSKFIIHNSKFTLFPATFWVAPQNKINIAIENIKLELQERLKVLQKQKKLVEAQRLEQKTNYDLEMLKETGWCHGIENYSSQLEFRKPGSPPFSLVDYFKHANQNGFLMFIDESHISTSQIRAMSVQDRIRKETLINYGFRLPSAVDNRPLTFKEFQERQEQTIYVSATPADYEKEKSGKHIIEQLVRPTGLLEPSIEIKKTENQIKDLIAEIGKEVAKKHRVLVITLTKRLAEEISDYLVDHKIKTQYLHSEVKTMQRPEILNDFRRGKYDVLVGINLLREGLDLPEVSLVAILDADKEGFLRNKTTLIQTMGRAARHPNGRIILYADKTTMSMKSAIDEINRRRKIQQAYNKKHNITPQAIIKDIRDWGFSKKEDVESEFALVHDKKLLEKEMKIAAKNLDFERAVELRDLIQKLENKNS